METSGQSVSQVPRPVDISVIVPVFNGGDKIEKCIDALRRQRTERVFEIIVVDDGSTDGSLRRITGQDIRVVEQENHGPAAARNLGVDESRGEIILFTDADCEPIENWIEQMVRPLADPTISGVKGTYLTRQKRIVPRFVQLEYESKYERMSRNRYIDFIDTYCAGFIKRDFLSVGKFDTRFPTASVEDQEFSFRMWEKGYCMVFNPEARVLHTHSENLWIYMKKKFKIGFWKALVLKKHPQKALKDSHTPQSLKFEMIFSVLFLICILLWPFRGAFLSYSFFPLCGFLATISPFVAKSFKKDPAVALFSPFLLFVRAFSLSFGLISGAFRFLVLRGSSGSEVERANETELKRTIPPR